jgi:hypothetical protein
MWLVSINTQAQYVIDAQHQPDSSRLIITNSKKFVIGNSYYSIHVESLTKDDSTTWYLCLSSYERLDANAEVLIKLDNEQLIFSHVNSVYVDGVMTPGVSYAIKNIAIHYPPIIENYYSSFFIIPETQLISLINSKITKIRIYTGRYYDEAINANRLRRLLANCHKNINNYIKQYPNTKSIFDNF